MKTLRSLCLALSLSLGVAGTAHADYGHHERHRHSHHHGRNWGSTAALLAITGVAIGAASYRYYQPAPVYSPPPRVIYAPAPTPGTWYYCASAGQYYPYVNQCPEGWEAVMPPPP